MSYGNKQERMTVAQICPEYNSKEENFAFKSRIEANEQQLICDECIHWNDGTCKIYDDVLSSVPERPWIGNDNI